MTTPKDKQVPVGPPFDPKERCIKVKGGRLYLQVSDRLSWLNAEREALGYEVEIDSELLHYDHERGVAVVKTTVRVPGRGQGCGIKSETRAGFANFLEKAQTGSLGRALAQIGFGTEYALEFREEDVQDGGELHQAVDTPRDQAVRSKTAVVATAAGGLTTQKGLVEKAGVALKQAAGTAVGDPLAQRRTHANDEIKRLAREHGYTPPQSYGALLKLATDQYGYTKLPPKVSGPAQVPPQLLEELVEHMKHVGGDPAEETASEKEADKKEAPSPFEQAPEAAAPPEREARYQGAIADFRRALEAYHVAAQLDDVIKLVRDLRKEGCLRQADAEALETLHADRVRALEKSA